MGNSLPIARTVRCCYYEYAVFFSILSDYGINDIVLIGFLYMEDEMAKAAANMVTLPKEEYSLLKEIYITVKRQNFLLRIDEAEKNLKAGKVKKVSVDAFIKNI